VNDDNPSPDVGNNKHTATMALSLEFWLIDEYGILPTSR
jgi:hypothetical protein